MNDTVVSPVVTAVAAPAALTKEQKIAKIREQIAKLEARIVSIETGVEAKVSKVAPMPAVGDVVSFLYGRKTATTEPVLKSGVVVAVKPSSIVGDKKLPAQVKVETGEGFDKAFITIYPAQVIAPTEPALVPDSVV